MCRKDTGDMSEPLIVGEEVLDYALKLFRAAQMLNDAVVTVAGLSGKISDAYEGEALKEMLDFAGSLTEHIGKLVQFYMKGGQYANAAFESMMENDEMMSEVMVNYMMHNQEVWTQWE